MFAQYSSRCLLLVCSAVAASEFSCQKNNDPPLPPFNVPDGYTVELAAGPDLVDYPMFVHVDPSGRLFVFESVGNVYDETKDALENPVFRINLLEDINGDGRYDKSTIFADSVGFPQGGVFYEGSLYATSAPDLLKLTDTDADGVADKREVLLSGWTLNINANSLIGPFMAPDGWLYMTSAIEGFDIVTKEGERMKGETSRVWRVRPDGSQLQWVAAGGMNNPVGLTFTEASEPLGTMTYFTDPAAGQRDALMYWTEGGVYPKPNSNIRRDNLPLTGDLMPVVSKYSRVAPAGVCRYRGTALGEAFHNNLFTAQFNTHRVLRHKLIREGASFRTEDEVFFSLDNEDFHPTDVQEDGDGSLLVVETGGWFIKGCPLSQVSKPELQGSIYRIRKKDAPPVDDPYGNNIDWSAVAPDGLTAYLDDPRPYVADRAIAKIAATTAAVPSLAAFLKSTAGATARIRALFALYRVNTPASIQTAQQGLFDADADVRTAAARIAGLARNQGALDRLVQMIKTDEAPCRRQAATALGQIGEPAAIPHLLAAAEGVHDRFITHAITYALISLNQPAETQAGLAHASPQVKRVAFIALDQMKHETLTAQHVLPHLAAADSLMRATAVWVASHHPEWANAMVQYLDARMRAPALTTADEQQLREILLAYGSHPVVQQFVARRLAVAGPTGKSFLLETMAATDISDFPASWATALGKELVSSADARMKMKVLNLVRMHNLVALAGPVRQVAGHAQNPAALRIMAMGALMNDSTQMPAPYFDFLTSQLQPGVAVPLRQQAAAVLSQGMLSQQQMLALADSVLPQADAFILPRLLPAFRYGRDLAVGNALTRALLNAPTLDNFTEESVRQLVKAYPPELNASVDQLVAKLNTVRAERLTRIHDIEKNVATGDIERGRMLFFGKAICYTCHAIHREGGLLGPDLTSIQRDRSAHDLIEAIVYPGVSFVREYETYEIKTKDHTYRGIIREQNGEFTLLNISPQESVRIPANAIVAMQILDESMMPQGLDRMLTTQELADLMAFLLGQDQDPETDAKLLR